MWKLLEAYEDAGGIAECYTDSCRMDESSFTVSMIDEDLWWCLPEELKSLGVDDIDAEVKEYVEGKTPWDAGVTKLLQYEWTVQLLFQLNGRWRAYSFRPAVLLQPVARTTGDCFYLALQAQRAALNTENLRLRFNRSQRLSTSDGDGALELAERAHMKASGIPTMRGHCRAHKICTARINTFQVQEHAVEFLTKCALSLRFGNVMKQFSASWCDIAVKLMVVVRDRTP